MVARRGQMESRRSLPLAGAEEDPDLVVKLEDRVHAVGRGADQIVGDHDDLRAGGGEQGGGGQERDEAMATPVEP